MFSEEIKQLAIYYKDKKSTSNLTRWKKPIYYQLLKETSFLPESASATQRIWHVLNDTNKVPKCKNCNKNTKWIPSYKPPQYSQYCSSLCASASDDTKQKRIDTLQEKYGVVSYSQTDEFKEQQKGKKASKQTKEKMKKAIHNRTPEQKQKILEKRRQTNLKRYEHINVLASEKVKNIKKEKYGTVNYTETEEFKNKRKKTMFKKYGVEYCGQSDELSNNTKNTNLERYGNEYWSTSRIPSESLNKLNNTEWLFTQHVINKIPSTQLAQLLQVDKETVGNYINKAGFNRVRHPSSYAEQQLCSLFEQHNIKYITNSRSIIPPKELDIYLPDFNTAIEYCGLYWHSTAHDRITRNYHKEKMDLCNNKGIRLITIFEDEWVHHQQLVIDKLLTLLNLKINHSIFARKCHIVEVSTKTKRQFFNDNHIQGDGPSSINIGLMCDNELVACMGFIKQKNQHYLNRYATNKQVIGGFSKLLKHFQNNYEWSKIVSFADLRWSDGNLYRTTGWKLDSILPPDYTYVNLNNVTRIHKFNFRHKNLKNILGEQYNPKLSETENTKNHNWFKIYNCGLQRWVIENPQ